MASQGAQSTSKVPPLKPPGIIKLPAPFWSEEANPHENLISALQLRDESTASLPALPDASGLAPERTLDRRTSTSSLNVKFAPLPQLAPRKRRSTAPLGVASRGATMRRRRAGTPGYDMNGDPIALPPTPPAWTEEEIERHTQRVVAEQNGLHHIQSAREVDDPFSTLGKFVKGAGKQLWRKVNKKPGEVDGAVQANGNGRTAVGGTVVAERTVLAPITGDNATTFEEEGGVWEEAVGDRFLNLSQTETIVEGQFPWSTTQMKPVDNDSVSDDASGKEHNLSSAEGTEDGASTQSCTLEEEG